VNNILDLHWWVTASASKSHMKDTTITWEAGLQIDIDKCEFEVKSTKYLEFILEVEKDVQMNSQKMKTIMNWQVFKSVKRVQSFIDFANFYWKFIKNFSNLIMSIMTLIQKNTFFKWTEKTDQSFKKLKVMFISVSILVSFNHTCTIMMKTDFSDWCIDEILLQLMNDVWRLCVYYSKKNASAECNYKIYDKEMLIIIQCLKSEMQNWEVCQIFRFVQITRIWSTLWQWESLQSDKWDDSSHCHDTTSSYYICQKIKMKEQTLC
jgi:hypothetical protein